MFSSPFLFTRKTNLLQTGSANWLVKNWSGLYCGINKSVCFDNSRFKILCSIVVLFERHQDVKISRQLDYGHKNVASSFGRNDAFPDIFPRTCTQPFLCDCRCQEAGQQGSAVVRPLLSAKCWQDHGGATHQGTWKLKLLASQNCGILSFSFSVSQWPFHPPSPSPTSKMTRARLYGQDRNDWHLTMWKVPFAHLCFEYLLVSILCFTPRAFVQRVVFEWIYAQVFSMLNIFFLQYASAEQEEEGRKRYEAQKMERLETKARPEEVMPCPPNPGNIFKLRVPYQFADTKPQL